MTLNEYDTFVQEGMPTYTCAGVTRHPIDEIYTWCESKRVVLHDQNNLCSRTQLKKLLGIKDKDLINWENAGLPRIVSKNKINGFKMYLYDKNDVIDWLKSQQNNVMGV